MTVAAYRITKARYAATIWTGQAARDHGGRWNSQGVAVVYAAENRSLAAMEQLVHLVPPRVLRGYVVSSINFDDRLMRRVDVATLPRGWDAPVAAPGLKKYGDEWMAAGQFPVLAVPSRVIRGEWNYLLNPNHPEFPAMPKSTPEPFVYDRRLE